MEGRYDEAIEKFLEILKRSPDNAQVRFNLAKAYKDKGLKKERGPSSRRCWNLPPVTKARKKNSNFSADIKQVAYAPAFST